jgi:hypothetical protein
MPDHTGMDISMKSDGNNRAGSEAGQPPSVPGAQAGRIDDDDARAR